MNAGTGHIDGAGSLLEGLNIPPSKQPGSGKAARPKKPFVPPILKDNRVYRWVKGHKRESWAIAGVLLVAGGIIAWRELRFQPPPDYAVAPMDDLLDYTLITDDFNKLPIDQRMDLLRDLIKRFSGMEGSESVLMAQWAAMIEGDLREQMMKNASLLAIDLWDKYATDYQAVPQEERAEYMDKTVIEFMKLMESFNPGGPRDISDEKRLEEAKAQAQRDQQMIRGGEISSGQLGQMADFMRNGMGQFAAPQTQARAAQLMRDMTRHLRGQDIATGKPLKGK